MNIEGLSAFLAVTETGSFTGAAEQLFLSQPAVSKRIAQLESDLDTRLFDRIGREVRLTQAGDALLPRARAILLTLEDTRRALHNLSGGIDGRLSFGTSHHIGLHRLPPLLREYSSRYPKVQLDIRFLDSEEAWDDIVAGSIELGIVTLPPKGLPSAGGSPHTDQRGPLRAEHIWDDPLAVVASPEHPLAGLRSVTLRALSRHNAILPSASTFTRRIVDAAFAARGLPTPVSISTNYLETIKMMAAVGLGWSVLPASMIDAQIVGLPVSELRIQRDLGVVYHPGRTLSNAARAMLEMLDAASDRNRGG
jgi:DNA-binding transcriptional LysR family regulator